MAVNSSSWALFQSLCPSSPGDTGGLRHQLRCRTPACLHLRRPQDQRASLLQVHSAGRSLWCSGVEIGPACPVHAAHSANLSAGEGRGLPRTVWMGGRMGSFTSRWWSAPLKYIYSDGHWIFLKLKNKKNTLICLKLKYMMKLMTNHLIILVVLIIGEVWGNEKMFADPAYLSIFFFHFSSSQDPDFVRKLSKLSTYPLLTTDNVSGGIRVMALMWSYMTRWCVRDTEGEPRTLVRYMYTQRFLIC